MSRRRPVRCQTGTAGALRQAIGHKCCQKRFTAAYCRLQTGHTTASAAVYLSLIWSVETPRLHPVAGAQRFFTAHPPPADFSDTNKEMTMNLTVSSPTPPASIPAAAPAGPALKWMWAAIGALGVSVLALGATLVMQNRAPAAADAAAPATLAAAPRTPESEIIEEKRAQAPVAPAQSAMNGGANYRPQTGGSAGRSGDMSGGMAPGGVAQPVRAAAPVCRSCGRVESVQAVQQAAPATGVGAVAGGVLGAVVGNQIGKGSGRTAATVLGAVGGGYVGHKVEERTRTHTVYQVAVRMEDGSLRHFQRAEPTAVGTPVVLQGKGFRVDQGGSARAADPYAQPQPQPGAVRVSDTY